MEPPNVAAVTSVSLDAHAAYKIGTPKMPGEPMRVQPSRARNPETY
jgi:hypothetical protein